MLYIYSELGLWGHIKILAGRQDTGTDRTKQTTEGWTTAA